MKKIIVLATLCLGASTGFTADFNEESVSFSAMVSSWSKMINKRVIINLPEQEKFSSYISQDKQIILENESQLPSAIDRINNLYVRKNFTPIHACVFSNALVIQHITKTCGEN